MSRPVQIARAAPAMHSAAVLDERHDLGHGVIVVHPTPGHGGEGIARDVLQTLGKQFRERTPRDPQRLQTLAGSWLRAEQTRELVIAGADRRPAADWAVLRDLCSGTRARLTLVVERPPNRDQLATLRKADVRELSVSELVYELPPPSPPDPWGSSIRAAAPTSIPDTRRSLTSTSPTFRAPAPTCCPSTTRPGFSKRSRGAER